MRLLQTLISSKEDIGLLLMRLGLSFVFIWFGIDKFISPLTWVKWVPEWFSLLPISTLQFIYFLGLIEIIISIFLLSGLFVRIAAAIAALQLLSIILSLGLDQITVRDAGLLFLALAMMLLGAGRIRFRKR